MSACFDDKTEGVAPYQTSKDDHIEESASLCDYEVVSVSAGPETAPDDVHYVVQPRDGGRLLVWRARSCQNLTEEQISNLKYRVLSVSALRNPRLLSYKEARLHRPTSTLYIITEHNPDRTLSQLIENCKNNQSIFRENFIWRVLYQLANVCETLKKIDEKTCQKRFYTNRIYVDPNNDLTVDPFYIVLDNESDDDLPHSNDIFNIASVIYEMCTLNKFTKENMHPLNCGKDLQKLLNNMLNETSSSKCNMTPTIILYHPTVLSHLDNSGEIFCDTPRMQTSTPTNDSAFESDVSLKSNNTVLFTSKLSNATNENLSLSNVHEEKFFNNITSSDLSPTIAALDLKIPGYVPRKTSDHVKKWKSRLDLCKEPREVSEDALSKVWLERLKTLRDREDAVNFKEKEMAKKKLFDEIRAKISCEKENTINNKIEEVRHTPGITLQTVMNEKLLSTDQANHQDSNTSSELKFNLDYKAKLRQLPKKSYRRSNVRLKCKKKIAMNYDDIDSSLSADPGDTSIVQTSSKLYADLISRPSSICSNSRKKVHFNSKNNPFAEYDSVSSTVHTFFNNEISNQSYETPIQYPVKNESVADRIAKFTYLDLEAITNKKRAMMEEWRKSPPMIEPVATFRQKKMQVDPKQGVGKYNPTVTVLRRTNRKSKYPSPRLEKSSSSSKVNACCSNSESGASIASYPSTSMKDRRKSLPFLSMNRNQSNSKRGLITSTNCISIQNNDKNDPECYDAAKSANRSIDQNVSGKKSKPSAEVSDNKENTFTPGPRKDKKRMSILGFKTPFKFRV